MSTNDTFDTQVIVTDIRMSFLSMIIFMVKWVLASIPALIILFLIGMFVMTVVSSTFWY